MRSLKLNVEARKPPTTFVSLSLVGVTTAALAVVVDQTGLDFSRNALDMGSGSFQEGGMD
jgi:hypothetical protein